MAPKLLNKFSAQLQIAQNTLPALKRIAKYGGAAVSAVGLGALALGKAVFVGFLAGAAAGGVAGAIIGAKIGVAVGAAVGGPIGAVAGGVIGGAAGAAVGAVAGGVAGGAAAYGLERSGAAITTGAKSALTSFGTAANSFLSGLWSGATSAVGGFFSGASSFFISLTSLTIPTATIAVPLFTALGAVTAGSVVVGIVTNTTFFTPQIDAAGEDVSENQYASISKTANPNRMTNEEAAAGREVTYTITLKAKTFPLTNVTISNTTTVSPAGSSSFLDFTTDKDGNDITVFNVGTLDPGATQTITYIILVQGTQYQNSAINDTAIANFTVNDKPSSISASASVTVGSRIVPGSCGGIEIGFNTTGITHYGYGEPFPFSNFSDVDADLAAIRDIGGTVVRVFAANDRISNAEASKRLGAFLDKAATYNISVIVTFIDFYNSHFRPQGTEKYYTELWAGGRLLGAEFYITGYKNEYLSFVQTLINDNKGRSNIYAWEVGNELKYDKNPSLFISFMQDITSIIKSLDSSHPISTGMINAGHTGLTPGDLYPKLPNIDIISVHTYDGDRSSGTSDVDWAIANGKKFINGEIGFAGGPGDDRSPKMGAELTYWKSKNASAILQWGFVAKGLGDNGNGDTINGMDTFFHTDYDQLATVFRNASATSVVTGPGETTPEQLQCYITQVATGKIEPRSGDNLANVMIRVMMAESGGNQCAAGTAAEIGPFQYIASTWRAGIKSSPGADSGSGSISEYRSGRSICWGTPGPDPVAVPPYDPSSISFNWPDNCGGTNKDCGAWDPFAQIENTVWKMEAGGACIWTTYKVLYPGICP